MKWSILVVLACVAAGPATQPADTQEIRDLKSVVLQLRAENARLKAALAKKKDAVAQPPKLPFPLVLRGQTVDEINQMLKDYPGTRFGPATEPDVSAGYYEIFFPVLVADHNDARDTSSMIKGVWLAYGVGWRIKEIIKLTSPDLPGKQVVEMVDTQISVEPLVTRWTYRVFQRAN